MEAEIKKFYEPRIKWWFYAEKNPYDGQVEIFATEEDIDWESYDRVWRGMPIPERKKILKYDCELYAPDAGEYLDYIAGTIADAILAYRGK